MFFSCIYPRIYWECLSNRAEDSLTNLPSDVAGINIVLWAFSGQTECFPHDLDSGAEFSWINFIIEKFHLYGICRWCRTGLLRYKNSKGKQDKQILKGKLFKWTGSVHKLWQLEVKLIGLQRNLLEIWFYACNFWGHKWLCVEMTIDLVFVI